jgi:hypothetical protein
MTSICCRASAAATEAWCLSHALSFLLSLLCCCICSICSTVGDVSFACMCSLACGRPGDSVLLLACMLGVTHSVTFSQAIEQAECLTNRSAAMQSVQSATCQWLWRPFRLMSADDKSTRQYKPGCGTTSSKNGKERWEQTLERHLNF